MTTVDGAPRPARRRLRLRGWSAGLLVLAGCHATRPSDLREPLADLPAVMVKSVRIPDSEPWYSRFAAHSWIDIRERRGGAWRRLEIPTPSSGASDGPLPADEAFADERWGRPVRVLSTRAGAEAQRMAADLRAQVAEYDDRVYRAWPGPNSNTFVERLVRRTEGLTVQLDHNAVGKDWAFPARLGATTSGLGLELELPGLGVQVGLLEGVELHLLGLTIGVGIYPLSLKIPFLPAAALAERPRLSYGWSPAAAADEPDE